VAKTVTAPGGYRRRRSEDMKTQELKITVAGADPDGTLAALVQRGDIWLKSGMHSLTVTKVERADGQEIGLEAEFEAYWRDNCCEGDHGSSDEKWAARHAFFYAVKLMKEKK
jgi:hypothetical protein